MAATIRLFTIADYPDLFTLWHSLPGFNKGLRSLDDSETGIAKFLDRNPNTCFVAQMDGHIIGGILAGHDGRRGYRRAAHRHFVDDILLPLHEASD